MNDIAPAHQAVAAAAGQHLLTHGYVIIPNLLSPQEVAARRDELLRLMAHEREHPFDPGDGPPSPQDEECAAIMAQWWNCDDDERVRLARRMRHYRAENFDTPWPMPPAQTSICFKHIPSVIDHGRSQRVFNLINKLPSFALLLEHPMVMSIIREQLGEDCILFDVSSNAVGPNTPGGALHMDTPLTDLPEPLPDYSLSIQSAWMLNDFTAENGATRVVPYSHLKRHRPNIVSDDGLEIALTGPAGSLAIWLSQTWHRHGPNSTTDNTRLGIIVQYGRAWMKPFADFRSSLTPERAAQYSPRLRYMMGCAAQPPVRG